MLCSGKRFLLPSPNLVALITMMGFLVANITAYATELGTDYSSNSEMELIELASGGDYQNKSITVATLNGETLLTVVTDGEKVESEMPFYECEALWNYVIAEDAAYLEDVIGGTLPDSSTFTLKIRVESNSHTIKVEGVDSLIDSRYKDIVKEIIRVAEMHTP
jgi:hypothetical protein